MELQLFLRKELFFLKLFSLNQQLWMRLKKKKRKNQKTSCLKAKQILKFKEKQMKSNKKKNLRSIDQSWTLNRNNNNRLLILILLLCGSKITRIKNHFSHSRLKRATKAVPKALIHSIFLISTQRRVLPYFQITLPKQAEQAINLPINKVKGNSPQFNQNPQSVAMPQADNMNLKFKKIQSHGLNPSQFNKEMRLTKLLKMQFPRSIK